MPPPVRFLSGFAAFAAIVKLASAGSCVHDPINTIPYCQSTDSITYDNIGFAGTYNNVVKMDSDSCTCQMEPKSFSGKLAPLSEEVCILYASTFYQSSVNNW